MSSAADDLQLIDSVYECSECSASYRNHGDLQRHLLKNHPELEAKHVCGTCGGAFKRAEDVQEHSSLRHNAGAGNDDSGTDNSSGPKRSRCNECGKRFSQPAVLRRHVISLHSAQKQKPKPKPKKSKKRKRKDEEQSDEESEETEEEETVDADGKRQRRHRALVHSDESGVSSGSTSPDETPTTIDVMMDQLRMLARTNPPPASPPPPTREYRFVKGLSCHVCSGSFGRPINLQRHLFARHVVRPEFESVFYSERYSSERGLDMHRKLSEKTRHPYELEVCGRKFFHLFRDVFSSPEAEEQLCDFLISYIFDHILDGLCTEKLDDTDGRLSDTGIDYLDVLRDECDLEPDSEIFPASWIFGDYSSLEHESERDENDCDRKVALETLDSSTSTPTPTRFSSTEIINVHNDSSEFTKAKRKRDFEFDAGAEKFATRRELQTDLNNEHHGKIAESSFDSEQPTCNENNEEPSIVESSLKRFRKLLADTPRRTSERISTKVDNTRDQSDSATRGVESYKHTQRASRRHPEKNF
uniref:C2H2-type domain-containing protein n=1 Tax=Trichogramma kaykai TaxID=54128 RepID=A0ABD2WBN7_9HYME